MVSIYFYPSIGGIEIITENLANEFARKGHKVTVVTNTPLNNGNIKEFQFKVLRNPSYAQLYKEYRKCDVYVHQSISLKYIWPLFFMKKPFFIVYHQVGWQHGIKGKMKEYVSKLAHNICVSKTTANGYKLKSYDIIYNAYNDEIFKCVNNGHRRDIAFVGRLNKGKGVYLLINAFNEFKKKVNCDYQLNIIGDSSERNDIEKYANSTQFASDIKFWGAMSPEQISQKLNKTHILVVPSTHPYYEAFGIVVLEGLACGCVVIGADGDGIEEALQSAGILYKNGDVKELCNALIKAYTMSEEEVTEKRTITKKWLAQRTLSKVASEYIEVFKRVIQ